MPGWRYLAFSRHVLTDAFNGMLGCLFLNMSETGSEENG